MSSSAARTLIVTSFSQAWSTIIPLSPTSPFKRKSQSQLRRQKRWGQEAISKAQADFETKTGKSSDEDNAETANSKNYKSTSKISVNQSDKQPLSTVKL